MLIYFTIACYSNITIIHKLTYEWIGDCPVAQTGIIT